MIFTTDSLYLIGHGPDHPICEDYAWAQVKFPDDEEVPFLIVSDGCGSSVDVDVGARLLARMAAVHLPRGITMEMTEPDFVEGVAKPIARAAYSQLFNLGMPRTALYATLLMAFTEGDMYHVLMFGDGAWFMTDMDGRLSTTTVTYSKNMPYYPAYLLDDGDVEFFNRPGNGEATIVEESPLGTFTTNRHTACVHFSGLIEHVKMLGIVSDGVGSFVSVDNSQPIEAKEILTDLAAIKNGQGQFVQRRLRKVVHDRAARRITNADDIAMAAMIRA